MNIETITKKQNYQDYLKFGWKLREEKTVRHGSHHSKEYVLERDKDMPNYSKIKELEDRYFAAKGRIRYYEPANPITAVVCFLLFILPGIGYLLYKNNEKTNIYASNSVLNKEMKEILTEVSMYL